MVLNDLHLLVQLTMSNVENKSMLLWVHCLMTWIVSLVVYRVSDFNPCAHEQLAEIQPSFTFSHLCTEIYFAIMIFIC